MRRVEKNPVALVTLSFSMPYLSFAVSVYYFNTSGVLAVIALGLVLNRFGHAFLNKNLEAVEGFWDQVEFGATMILYSQVGIFVAADFLLGSITAVDWGSLFGLFLWVLLVRLIVVVISLPVLMKVGYGLSWQEAIILWHGGLRGAISILLSFSIKNAVGVSDRTGALVLFFTAGIVVLFLFNVITTGPLCRLLGLQFDSTNKVFCRMKFKVEENTLKTLLNTGMAEDVARKGIGFYMKKDDENNARGETPKPGNVPAELSVDMDVLAVKRLHMCMAFKTTFSGLLEVELIPRSAWFLLVNACEKVVDNTPVSSLLSLEDVVGKGTFFRAFVNSTVLYSSLFCCGARCNRCRGGLGASSTAEPTSLRSVSKEENIERSQVLEKLLKLNFEETMDVEVDDSNEDVFSAVETLAYCAFGLIVAHQRGRRVLHEIFAVFDEGDSAPEGSVSELFSQQTRPIARIAKDYRRIQSQMFNPGSVSG